MPPWVTVIGRSSRDVGGQPLLERRRCTLTIQHQRRPCRHADWIPPLWDATHDGILAEGCRVAAFWHRKRAPARTAEAAPNSIGPREMSAWRKKEDLQKRGARQWAARFHQHVLFGFAKSRFCKISQTLLRASKHSCPRPHLPLRGGNRCTLFLFSFPCPAFLRLICSSFYWDRAPREIARV